MPEPSAGLRRCFNFATYECRAALTSRKGYKDPTGEKFTQFAELHSLPNCESFALVEEPTIIAGTQTRGALATAAVDVTFRLAFRHKSGFERKDIIPGEERRVERFLFTLEQQRRPPLQGCWTIRGLLPARDHMLFNGDSGAVQG